MEGIKLIDAGFIEKHTKFKTLIDELEKGFSNKDMIVPMRHHHDFPNPKANVDSTLLLMPAWNPGKEAGIKIITVSPENGKMNLPSIQGTYIYLDSAHGTIKALLDAKTLTTKRTAAASALASSYLSKKDSSSMLMIGTGALAPNLIFAHASIRPIKKVYVWGRNFNKAEAICHQFENQNFEISAVHTIEEIIGEVDIISCATFSKSPLVYGKYLKKEQHIDLVGSYKPDMREADDEAIKRSRLYIDTYPAATKESGDIVVPLEKGLINEDDIQADLFDLCSNRKPGRQNDAEITLFKSVGHALEDLVAATYYYEKFNHD